MKQLMKVRVSYYTMVMAESETEARAIARDSAKRDVGNASLEYLVKGVDVISEVPMEWRSSLPWNGDGRKLVRQILDESLKNRYDTV